MNPDFAKGHPKDLGINLLNPLNYEMPRKYKLPSVCLSANLKSIS